MSLLNYFRRVPEESAAHEIESDGDRPTTPPKRPASPVSTTDSKTQDKKFKFKHAKSFNHKWMTGRSWLKYTEGLGMFCDFCQELDRRPFDRDMWNKAPCTRMRLESIHDHEKCQSHLDATNKKAEALKHKNIAVAIVPSVSRQHITKAFACLYFLCKQRMSHTTNYEPLLDFLGFLGDNLKDKLYMGRNAHYTSRKSIQEMLNCMSDLIENEIIEEVKSSEHYSLMFDETTDCSVREQMTLRARYIDGNGEIKVKFLKVVDCLTDRITLDAITVSDIVIKYIEDHELSYSRLRGIGTDGASVMTGRLNGAVKRIQTRQLCAQSNQPFACEAVGCHCSAHKLNLAAQQAGDAEYMKKFKGILRQLYDFFDNSAVRSAGLLAVQKLLQCPEKKVIEPSSTRWLSIGNSVLRLKDILPSVICSLGREAEERGNAVAAGLYQFLSNYQFVCTLLLLSDVLPKVNLLSKAFQKTHLDFSAAILVRKSIVSQLEELKLVDGEHLKAVDVYITELEKSGIQVKYQRGLKDDSSSRVEAKSRFMDKIKAPFLKKLVANINDRFADSGTLGAFGIFESDRLKIGSSNENYGNDDVQLLIQRFGGFSVREALTEWDMFKRFFHDHLRSLKGQQVVDNLCCDRDNLRNVFPIMSFLAACYKVMPPHTADCERDFSQMKLIKTYVRNRMCESTLDGIMRIVIEGPDVNAFPFDNAVKMWADRKHRRLH